MQFDLGSFGDGNPYTVFSHDLKSVLTSVPNSAWSFFALVGSGLPPVADPELGTIFKDVNGADAGYRFTTMGATLAQLPYEGHIKIKVESKWLCAPAASSNGNSGNVLQTTEGLLSALPSTGAALPILQNGGSTNAVTIFPGASANVACSLSFLNHIAGVAAASVLHMAGKPRFVDVDIFWKGKFGFFAVDGAVLNCTITRSVIAHINFLNNFYVGSDRGVATRYVNAHYAKDLEIRTKCPEFSLNYHLRRIGVLSDSVFDDSVVSATAAGDVTARVRIQRKLNQRGQYCNLIISENGGFRVHNTGSNWIGAPATILTALANDPVEVLVNAGMNDIIFAADTTTITNAMFQSACIDVLEKLFGVNGNPTTRVKRVKWLEQIPLQGITASASYAAYVINATRFRLVINNLPALWDAAYPALAGAVSVIPIFAALGGESTSLGSDLYVGQLTGALNDLHLGAHGLQLLGDAVADRLIA